MKKKYQENHLNPRILGSLNPWLHASFGFGKRYQENHSTPRILESLTPSLLRILRFSEPFAFLVFCYTSNPLTFQPSNLPTFCLFHLNPWILESLNPSLLRTLRFSINNSLPLSQRQWKYPSIKNNIDVYYHLRQHF